MLINLIFIFLFSWFYQPYGPRHREIPSTSKAQKTHTSRYLANIQLEQTNKCVISISFWSGLTSWAGMTKENRSLSLRAINTDARILSFQPFQEKTSNCRDWQANLFSRQHHHKTSGTPSLIVNTLPECQKKFSIPSWCHGANALSIAFVFWYFEVFSDLIWKLTSYGIFS